MQKKSWAAGIDLGGTKIQLLQLDTEGNVGEKIRCETDVQGGPQAIQEEIIRTLKQLEQKIGCSPVAIGIGIAGQIEEKTGKVLFAPNLKWENVPIQEMLYNQLHIPLSVLNDVRAATWGEWLHGAGKEKQNLLCIFVGTGIGGGIVFEGKMLAGSSNSAGEIGHMVVSLNGPRCTCGNNGCMEAIAGGWAMTEQAKKRIRQYPEQGKILMKKTDGDAEAINGRLIMEAALLNDPLSKEIIQEATAALAAGTVSLVNILNPECIVFGGGVIEGMPEIVQHVESHVRQHALKAATKELTIVRAQLQNNAGAIGAAAYALKTLPLMNRLQQK